MMSCVVAKTPRRSIAPSARRMVNLHPLLQTQIKNAVAPSGKDTTYE